ncbi:DUF1669 domain-containing protein [Candidatus Babeliales bacterium]|nr:DUF1669 domain-containing protein [Candidatus Babeliales bacterium]
MKQRTLYLSLLIIAVATPIVSVFSSTTTSIQVFFSPEDHLTEKLITKIKEAEHKIWAAVYMITDKRIANALIEAKNRGIDVQIVTDAITQESMYGKAHMLTEAGVNVRVFSVPSWSSTDKKKKLTRDLTKTWNNAPIMHNKFAIIDNIVWSGSFNWTVAANRKNRENATVIDDKVMLLKFCTEFSRLKHQSVPQEDWTNIRSLVSIVKEMFTKDSDLDIKNN